MRTLKISLPCFSGFYGYDDEMYDSELVEAALEDSFPYYAEALSDNNLWPEYHDKVNDNIDWPKTFINVSKRLIPIWEDVLSDYVSTINFLELISPKEYNFDTDRIFADVSLTDVQYITLKNICLYKKLGDFNHFLFDNYKSYSGFVSHIPDNPVDFEDSLFLAEKDMPVFGQELDKLVTVMLEFAFTWQVEQSGYCYHITEANVTPCDCEEIYCCIEYRENWSEEIYAMKVLSAGGVDIPLPF